jgi:hypothetical protein
MRVNSSGNTYFNGCVGIGTNTFNTSYQLQLPYNASYTTQLRCEGGSGTIPLSIGGSGNIYVDAPGNVGGRFTILSGGSVGIGTSNPTTSLQVVGTLNATTIQENGVNLTTKYQTNVSATSTIANTILRPYPPTYLTSANTTITNSAYGNGTYIATAGSSYIGQDLFYCIGSNPSFNPSFNQWTSGPNTINSSGNYTGTNSTLINGSAVVGETATIQLPYNVVINNYSLTANGTASYNTAAPNTWYFCGSTDGTNYTQLDYRTGVTYPVNTGSFITSNFTFTNTTGYNYYRFVIKSTSGTGYTQIICDGMTLFGYEARNGALIGAVGIGTNSLNYNSSFEVYGGYTYLSSSVGIGTSPNGTTSLIVSGTTVLNGNVGIGSATPNTNFDVNGKIMINNGSAGPPVIAQFGGSGDRIILFGGGATAYPYSLGINSSTLWYSTPANHTFYCNGINMLTLTSSGTTVLNGYFGIGTNNPGTALDVNGVINVSNIGGTFGGPSNISAYGGFGDRIVLFPGIAGSTFPYSIGMNSSTMWFSVPQTGTYLWSSNTTGTTINSNMYLDNTGSLNIYNDISCFTSASDIKLKENIKPLEINCIDLINKFKPVEFTWKDIKDVPGDRKNTVDYGFIAQEIEELLPHLIKETSCYKTIKYEKFAPYLVKAIQELSKTIIRLETKIDDLTSEIEYLKNK